MKLKNRTRALLGLAALSGVGALGAEGARYFKQLELDRNLTDGVENQELQGVIDRLRGARNSLGVAALGLGGAGLFDMHRQEKLHAKLLTELQKNDGSFEREEIIDKKTGEKKVILKKASDEAKKKARELKRMKRIRSRKKGGARYFEKYRHEELIPRRAHRRDLQRATIQLDIANQSQGQTEERIRSQEITYESIGKRLLKQDYRTSGAALDQLYKRLYERYRLKDGAIYFENRTFRVEDISHIYNSYEPVDPEKFKSFGIGHKALLLARIGNEMLYDLKITLDDARTLMGIFGDYEVVLNPFRKIRQNSLFRKMNSMDFDNIFTSISPFQLDMGQFNWPVIRKYFELYLDIRSRYETDRDKLIEEAYYNAAMWVFYARTRGEKNEDLKDIGAAQESWMYELQLRYPDVLTPEKIDLVRRSGLYYFWAKRKEGSYVAPQYHTHVLQKGESREHVPGDTGYYWCDGSWSYEDESDLFAGKKHTIWMSVDPHEKDGFHSSVEFPGIENLLQGEDWNPYRYRKGDHFFGGYEKYKNFINPVMQ